MDAEIEIQSATDWDKISKAGLKVVVDPMVFRTADVFLRGAKGFAQSSDSKSQEKMWSAISGNIGALCTFFDTLILEDRLPMYDYGMTFPPDLETGKHTLVEYCNETDNVLVTVSVQQEAYKEMKREAVAILDELPNISDTLSSDILQELSAFDWEWRPDLWRDEKIDDKNDQCVLDAFRYGGILFSGYAQRTGSDHILQPKRARLYLATSLCSDRADDEMALFSELTRISSETPEGVQRTGDLPATPTFLPYLLKHDDKTPYKLLKHALKLRKSCIVEEYRHWRNGVMDDIDKGRVLTDRRKEIARLAAALTRELKVDNKGETKVSAKIGAKVATLGPEVGAELGIERAWNLGNTLGWLLRNIPGHRYRKLLMHLIIAQQEYLQIDKHLKSLWYAAK
jgi:hypothetical protein